MAIKLHKKIAAMHLGCPLSNSNSQWRKYHTLHNRETTKTTNLYFHSHCWGVNGTKLIWYTFSSFQTYFKQTQVNKLKLEAGLDLFTHYLSLSGNYRVSLKLYDGVYLAHQC